MSNKFGKNRSVDWRYLHVPLKYQETLQFSHKKEIDKDLVVIDDYGKILVCAIKNNITGKCGKTFICKKVYKKNGIDFEWKGKLYKYSSRNKWTMT